MTWILEHWSEITVGLGALATVVSVVVGLTPSDKDDRAWARVMRVLSAVRYADEDGSIKLPLSDPEPTRAGGLLRVRGPAPAPRQDGEDTGRLKGDR